MKGGGNLPDPAPDTGNLSADDVATNAEAAVLPVFAGEALLACRWISEPFNQFTREAPADRPGKK